MGVILFVTFWLVIAALVFCALVIGSNPKR